MIGTVFLLQASEYRLLDTSGCFWILVAIGVGFLIIVLASAKSLFRK
jgi:hypothetical protein